MCSDHRIAGTFHRIIKIVNFMIVKKPHFRGSDQMFGVYTNQEQALLLEFFHLKDYPRRWVRRTHPFRRSNCESVSRLLPLIRNHIHEIIPSSQPVRHHHKAIKGMLQRQQWQYSYIKFSTSKHL